MAHAVRHFLFGPVSIEAGGSRTQLLRGRYLGRRYTDLPSSQVRSHSDRLLELRFQIEIGSASSIPRQSAHLLALASQGPWPVTTSYWLGAPPGFSHRSTHKPADPGVKYIRRAVQSPEICVATAYADSWRVVIKASAARQHAIAFSAKARSAPECDQERGSISIPPMCRDRL